MAEISLSLATLFEQTFGYKTLAFEPKFEKVTGRNERKEQGVGGSAYYATDASGVEYYMPVTLIYTETNGRSTDTNDDATLKRWNLPYPVISIECKKTIIETALAGRNGTVKELIGAQDYVITIKGVIVGANNEFPEESMSTLRSIYEQNIALSIECPLTDIFLLRPNRNGSDKVVMSELKLPVVTGVKNIRAYELKLLSDEAFNLITI
jgi:hypothetical protein